jgi:carbonic anhydrase
MCMLCQQKQGLLSRRTFGLFAMSSAALLLASGADAKEKQAPPKPENVLSPEALAQGKRALCRGRDAAARLQARARGIGGRPKSVCGDSELRRFPHRARIRVRQQPRRSLCVPSGRKFAADETVASLEYAVAVLNTPLILVLGHESCGAVDATIKSLRDDKPLPGHLPSLVQAIAPAVKAVSSKGGDVLNNAIRQNVIDNVAKLKSATPILSAALNDKKIQVVGGIYRLASGKVELVS